MTARIRIEAGVEVEVYCDECGVKMEIASVDDTSPYWIRVKPCSECIEQAKEEALAG